MRNRNPLSFARLALFPLALGLGSLFSCAGNERAPHQPVKGVDTEKNEVKNPYDKMSALPAPGRAGVAASEEAPSEAKSSEDLSNQDAQNKGGEESGQDAFAFLSTFRAANR